MIGARLSRRPEDNDTRARARARPAARDDAQRVLALQRTAGNRAVASLVCARSPRGAIQRAPMIYDWDHVQTVKEIVHRDGESVLANVSKFMKTIDAAKLNYYELEEWLDKAKAHPEADNQMLKEVRDLRDAKAPAQDARIAIKAFEDSTGQLAFDVDRHDVGRHLRAILTRPEKINQGEYGLCGPDAFLRAIAIRHPEAYVNYVIDLVKTGDGQIGGLTVHASRDVRRKHIAPGGTRHGIEAADWAALASLRVAKNTQYKAIGTMERTSREGIQWIHMGIASATDPDEIETWAAQLGLPAGKREMRMKKASLVSNVFTSRAGSFGHNWARIQTLRSQGWDVMLAIHQKVMKNTGELPRAVLGGHFVLLTSDIVPETQNGHAGQGFDAMTWGGISHGWFRDTDAGIALIGYVALDLSGPLGPTAATTTEEDTEVSADEVKSAVSRSSSSEPEESEREAAVTST
jgi:hypothetical protein